MARRTKRERIFDAIEAAWTATDKALAVRNKVEEEIGEQGPVECCRADWETMLAGIGAARQAFITISREV